MLVSDLQTIRRHFVESFRDDIHIVFANQPVSEAQEGTIWARFSVRPGEQFHVAGGRAGVMIQQGRVWLQVFQPEQTGDADSLDIVDEFAALFRNARLDPQIDFGMPDIDINPVLTDGYAMMTASVPFESFTRLT